MIFLMGILGLMIGSFFAAWTYRIVNNRAISAGRSQCPTCGVEIAWYDNIPLFSYLLLKGKCRHCSKHISLRYPIIESSYAIVFILTWINLKNISGVFTYAEPWGLLSIFLLFAFFCFSLAVFIVDYETQLIPDTYTFFLFLIALLLNIDNPLLYSFLLSGFVASLCLLFLNVVTGGRGMGLGDVKLALAFGLILGPWLSLYWIMGSFVIGAIVGVILLMFGSAELKSRIAFGPFLILSFFAVIACATINLI